jgi:hypothetical protein
LYLLREARIHIGTHAGESGGIESGQIFVFIVESDGDVFDGLFHPFPCPQRVFSSTDTAFVSVMEKILREWCPAYPAHFL